METAWLSMSEGKYKRNLTVQDLQMTSFLLQKVISLFTIAIK